MADKLTKPDYITINVAGNQVALILTHELNTDKVEIITPIIPNTSVPDYICAVANVARRFHNDPDEIKREATEYRAYYRNKYPLPNLFITKADKPLLLEGKVAETETTMSNIPTDQLIKDLVEIEMLEEVIQSYHNHYIDGGSLHIVLEEDNWDKKSILYCLECAQKEGDYIGEGIAKMLLKMPDDLIKIFDSHGNAYGFVIWKRQIGE